METPPNSVVQLWQSIFDRRRLCCVIIVRLYDEQSLPEVLQQKIHAVTVKCVAFISEFSAGAPRPDEFIMLPQTRQRRI